MYFSFPRTHRHRGAVSRIGTLHQNRARRLGLGPDLFASPVANAALAIDALGYRSPGGIAGIEPCRVRAIMARLGELPDWEGVVDFLGNEMSNPTLARIVATMKP